MASTSDQPDSNSQRTGRSTRKSIRSLLDKVYESPSAELVVNLDNIRKKLNFTSNGLGSEDVPTKRQKRDNVRCSCHLTIWDNRDGFAAIPLTTKSTYCRVTSVSTETNGYFVDVDLDSPFVVGVDELKVSVDTKQGSILALIDKYFLEIKIIPSRADSRWPPIPLLGKSDGDHFSRDIRKTGSEELSGAVVARYTHLPQAPDADTPLSVFFLHEGRTYRTKYGLQVKAIWQKGNSNHKPVREEKSAPDGLDLTSFAVPETNDAEIPATQKPRLDGPVSAPPVEPEVCYSFCSTLSPQVTQGVRKATVKGFKCPMCALRLPQLQLLQFHLTTSHPKYKFSVQPPAAGTANNTLTEIVIKVDVAPPVRKDDDTRVFDWSAPRRPFDLCAYVDGDHSWVGLASSKRARPDEPSHRAPSKATASSSALLRASDIPDFRSPRRKKYRAIKLATKYAAEENVYTSVSHRAVSPSEEPRSETDDEIDNHWQIELHMDRLDLMAKREGWAELERELYKRWDRHRMEEQLEHSKYLANSLVRFVRKHRVWLMNSDDELLTIFFEFLGRLKEHGVIDDNVVCMVHDVVFPDRQSMYSPGAPVFRNGQARWDEWSLNLRRPRPGDPLTSRPTYMDAKGMAHATLPRPAVGSFLCGHCRKPIERHLHNAVFCVDSACQQPKVMYHRACAQLQADRERENRLREKERANCYPRKPFGLTSTLLNPLKPSMGGMRMDPIRAPSANPPKQIDPLSWFCSSCVQRHRALARDLANEKAKTAESAMAASVETSSLAAQGAAMRF